MTHDGNPLNHLFETTLLSLTIMRIYRARVCSRKPSGASVPVLIPLVNAFLNFVPVADYVQTPGQPICKVYRPD